MRLLAGLFLLFGTAFAFERGETSNGATLLESFELSGDFRGTTLQVTRDRCKKDKICSVLLTLRRAGKTLTQVDATGFGAGNGRAGPTEPVKLLPGPATPAWSMDEDDTLASTTVAATLVQLDARTQGVLLYRQYEGDFIRRHYQVWIARVPAKPTLSKVFEAAPGAGGPFTNVARFFPGHPLRVAIFTKPFMENAFGEDQPDQFWFEAQSWGSKAGRFLATPSVPLHAAILGSYPSLAEAKAFRSKLKEGGCEGTFLIYATDGIPKLKPKLFIVGDVFLDEKAANELVNKARKCQGAGQAYVKRAY